MGDLISQTTGGIIGMKYGGKNELGELKPFQKDIFLFSTYVAGTSHVEGIEELEPFLKVDDRLSFYREPNNKADEMAIMVVNADKTKIGYVPQKDNVVFARLMDAGKLLFGKITSKEVHGKWVKISMDIYLHE